MTFLLLGAEALQVAEVPLLVMPLTACHCSVPAGDVTPRRSTYPACSTGVAGAAVTSASALVAARRVSATACMLVPSMGSGVGIVLPLGFGDGVCGYGADVRGA